jgi:signal transduction histidine kinase
VDLSRSTRTALLALAAAVLLGTLAFLYQRSSAIDFRRDAETASLLRELRALDARVDADAQQLANQLAPMVVPLPDRGPVLERILRELERRAAASISGRVPDLRAGMTEKGAALSTLKTAHAASLAALQSAEEGLAALAEQANAARLKNPRSAPQAQALAAEAQLIRVHLRGATMDALAGVARDLAPRLATLREAAAAADPSVAETAARAEAAARTFLEARTAEARALERVSFHTVGPRIDLTSLLLSRSTEAALDEQERWRVYLFFYAGALLIAVAWLVSRVIASQAALRAANEGLEKRVAERTQELSLALKRLKESEAQLVQTEKMSSLGQMVAGVAHEINTPLAYVKNSVATARDRMPELRDAVTLSERLLTLLQSESPDPKDLQDAFGALSARLGQLREHRVIEDLDALTKDGLHGIEQISELVSNLKNFSRLDRSRVASFNVNEGVQATLLIAKTQLRNVRVEKRLGEVPSINCSPSQVNQVLLNLVTNAAQAMDKPDARIIVATRAAGKEAVAIEVADNGKGIPAEVLPKIFDPFFTTKEIGKGTGLGLSIAYKIVEQHGGKIEVKSAVGKGTVFTVTLPVHPPPELHQAEAA